MANSYTLFYDKDCGICQKLVEFVARLPLSVELDFEPIAGVRSDQLLADLDEETLWASAHLVTPDNTHFKGAQSVLETLKLSPYFRFVTLLQRVPGFNPLAELIYSWVARNRQKIFRSQCRWQPPTAPKS